jgi:hypothetical protein
MRACAKKSHPKTGQQRGGRKQATGTAHQQITHGKSFHNELHCRPAQDKIKNEISPVSPSLYGLEIYGRFHNRSPYKSAHHLMAAMIKES